MAYERAFAAGDGLSGGAVGNTLSPKEFHEVDARMQNRLDYLTQTCSDYGLDKPGKTYFQYP